MESGSGKDRGSGDKRGGGQKRDGFAGAGGNASIRRIGLRAGAALLLGLAVFVILALAAGQFPAPAGMTVPAAAAPDNLRRDGDTIGLGQIIRFRVIAASDSSFDQAVKLKVRDSVLDYLRPDLQGAASESGAASLITGRLPGIRRVAQQTVLANGSDLPVQVCWGITAFPNKAYGPVFYPAGNYQALKIVIGPGQGHNWWCVLFPPLCYVDLTRAADDLSGGQEIAVGAASGRYGQASGYPRLTTWIGAWLSGAGHRSLLSCAWWK